MAVYTEISSEEFKEFLSIYDIGVFESADGIAKGIENSNYLLTLDSGKYIFTIYEKRVKSEDLPFFLSLIEHLSQKDIPSPVPVHAIDGNVLQKIHNKPCSIASFLEGGEPDYINEEHCREVGKIMAKIHLGSEDFPMHRENTMEHGAWKQMFSETKSETDSIAEGMTEEIAECIDTVDRDWPKGLPSGVIHGDLFPDNVFFIDDKVSGVLDFYFACNDFFAYDIAITMNAWCFEGDNFSSSKAKAMLESYNSVKPFTDDELKALPILARGAALRFLLSRIYDWINRSDGAMVTPKDPLEYLKILRFHMNVKNHEEYGL